MPNSSNSSNSSKDARDNRANQLNPDHSAYYLSRGASLEEAQRLAEHHRSLREGASYEPPREISKRSPVKPQ